MDLKMTRGNLGYKGAKMGSVPWRQNKENVTEHHESRNKSLWELKWPLSAYSG